MKKILIIEDEATIAQLIRLYLEQANYQVLTAGDGVAGLELHARERPDLVILDLMLPVMDGTEVCRRIRAWANTPILMLTARQAEEDRIAGLELGADDYLVKPFSPREVVSRVKAILRRSAPVGDAHTEQIDAPLEAVAVRNGEPAFAYSSQNGNQATAYGIAGKNTGKTTEEIRFDGLRICIPERRVEVHGQVASLTAKEFDLLVTLASAPGRVFTRETLLEHIWGYTFLGDGRTVDVHIGTLRKKLEVAGGPGTPHYIKTVWGLGYKFDPEGL
ncbi:MAG TPA: response regulator transcription factor [Ktedonobacteraceae bacterium]|nr:response regulator transcription factor [Ktedonobacteraceae bacterium]